MRLLREEPMKLLNHMDKDTSIRFWNTFLKGYFGTDLIIQNDSIVYEKCTGEMAVDKIAGVFSVTKSVTSLLCGIAVDEGYIKSIDDPVTVYLTELLKEAPMWQKLTIRHLLDMQSGLDFDDTYAHIPYLFEQLSNIWPECL